MLLSPDPLRFRKGNYRRFRIGLELSFSSFENQLQTLFNVVMPFTNIYNHKDAEGDIRGLV